MQIAAHTTRSQQQQEPGVCVRCWETSRKVVFKPCCALLGGLIRNNKAYTYMLLGESRVCKTAARVCAAGRITKT